MVQVFFIIWRESIEILLIVGILYTWLNNTNTRYALPYLWSGVIVGIIISVVFGIAIFNLSEVFSGNTQTYFQISIVLIAAWLIVHMVFWMHKHGNTLKKSIESSIKKNSQDCNFHQVFFLTVLAIAREGSEITVFLYSISIEYRNENYNILIFAGIFGFILAFITFYLLQLSSKIFSWQYFFYVTEIILLLLAANLFLTGIEKLIDVLFENSDWFSSLSFVSNLTVSLWDSSWLLDDSSIFGNLMTTLTGYRAKPTLINVIVYLLYLFLIQFKLRRLKNTKVNHKPIL